MSGGVVEVIISLVLHFVALTAKEGGVQLAEGGVEQVITLVDQV